MITLLNLWAKSGIACGWLYTFLERIGEKFSPRKRTRKLFNGLLMNCDLRDHVQRQVYFFGAYEPIEADLFLSLIKKGDTVIDAGANVGFYSLLMADKVGHTGKVHSFEPIPNTYEILRQHIQGNRLPQVVLNKKALWHQNGQLKFSLSEEHRLNSGGYSASSSIHSISEVTCDAVTLDDYVNSNGINKIHAIKMDIEGAEKFALQGAMQSLSHHHPVVFLEVCRETCGKLGYQTRELWDLLRPVGYRIYKVASTYESSGWIETFDDLIQSNVLLIPANEKSILDQISEYKWDDKKIRKKYLTAGTNYRPST